MRAPFASTTSTILALAPHPLEEFISLGRDVAQAIGASSYIRIIPSKIIAIARAHVLVLMEVEAEFGEIGACAEPFWHWRSWHSGLAIRLALPARRSSSSRSNITGSNRRRSGCRPANG